MTIVDWLGSIGVLQILLAYYLNVVGKIETQSLTFIGLNLVGSTMACFASVLLQYWPFIVLEGVWALVSIFSLIRFYKKRSS